MSFYSIVNVTPTSEDWIPDYVAPTTEAVARHGGKYLARTASHEQIEGDVQDATLRVIIEWPSREAAQDFLNDPQYAPHFKARTEGSVSHHFLIEGIDDLT